MANRPACQSQRVGSKLRDRPQTPSLAPMPNGVKTKPIRGKMVLREIAEKFGFTQQCMAA
jgi:hypothetical protein